MAFKSRGTGAAASTKGWSRIFRQHALAGPQHPPIDRQMTIERAPDSFMALRIYTQIAQGCARAGQTGFKKTFWRLYREHWNAPFKWL